MRVAKLRQFGSLNPTPDVTQNRSILKEKCYPDLGMFFLINQIFWAIFFLFKQTSRAGSKQFAGRIWPAGACSVPMTYLVNVKHQRGR